MVKAVMPSPNQQKSARPAVHRQTRKKCPPDTRLADLRMPPLPEESTGTLLMMTQTTQWSDSGSSERVVIAVHRAQQSHPPATVRTLYAVVPTPSGWLVIQI
jgi:hypothetical protein